MTTLDLSTVVSFRGVSYDGGGLVVAPGSNWGEFTIPAMRVDDLTRHYGLTVHYEGMEQSGYVALWTIPSPDQSGYDNGSWWRAGEQNLTDSWRNTGVGSEIGNGTLAVYLGPGIADYHLWADENPNDRYLIVDFPEGARIVGMEFAPVTLQKSNPITVQYEREKNMRSSAPFVNNNGSNYGHLREETIKPYTDEFYIYGAGDMQRAARDANRTNDGIWTGEDGAQGYTTQGTEMGVSYKYGPGGVVDGDKISTLYGYHYWSARPVHAEDNFYPPTDAGPMPDGAIGYEWVDGQPGFYGSPTPETMAIRGDLTDLHVRVGDNTMSGVMASPNVWQPSTTVELWMVVAPHDDSGVLEELPNQPHLVPEARLVAEVTLVRDQWGANEHEATYKLTDLSGGASVMDITGQMDFSGMLQWAMFVRSKEYTPLGFGEDISILFGEHPHAYVGGRLSNRLAFRIGYTAPAFRWIYPAALETEVGRLKVNVGSEADPYWKFAVPQPGENDGYGRLKVNIGTEASPVWKIVDPSSGPGLMKINVGSESAPEWKVVQ